MSFVDSDDDDVIACGVGIQVVRQNNGLAARLPARYRNTPYMASTGSRSSDTLVITPGHPVVVLRPFGCKALAVAIDDVPVAAPSAPIPTAALAIGDHAMHFVVDGTPVDGSVTLRVVAAVYGDGDATYYVDREPEPEPEPVPVRAPVPVPAPAPPLPPERPASASSDSDVDVDVDAGAGAGAGTGADVVGDTMTNVNLVMAKDALGKAGVTGRLAPGSSATLKVWTGDDWPIQCTMPALMGAVRETVYGRDNAMQVAATGVRVKVSGTDEDTTRAHIEALAPELAGRPLIALFSRKSSVAVRTTQEPAAIAGLVYVKGPGASEFWNLSIHYPDEGGITVGDCSRGKPVKRMLTFIPAGADFFVKCNAASAANMCLVAVTPVG